MAVSTAQVGDICITTQVVSASQSQAPVPMPVEGLPAGHSVTPLKKLAHAKALSAVLILIGVMQLSLGASMSVAENNYPSLVVRSGVYLWGGLVFIVTGVTTVILATKESILRVKVCLVSHGINAAVALLSILLYSLQLYTEVQACWVNTNVFQYGNINTCISTNSTELDWNYSYYSYRYESTASHVAALREAVTSLVLLYVAVGLTISISVILMIWKTFKKSVYSML